MRYAFGFLCIVLPLLAVAPAAHADGADVIRDCTRNGALTKRYSPAEYREALVTLPADVDEYGDCREIIREAQLDVASGGDGIGESPLLGTAALSQIRAENAQERRALSEAQTQRPPKAIDIAGEAITPGRSATSSGATGLLNKLPVPLIVALSILAVAALGAPLFFATRRIADGLGRR